MERETVLKFAETSRKKADFLKSSLARYFVMSMMAGLYVGLGIILIFSIGAPLKAANAPGLKALMGASFAIALSLVIFAGSELFTGNNMTMLIGKLEKRVSWGETINIWIVSWVGNLAGSVLLGFIMAATGLLAKDPLAKFIVDTTAAKMTAPFSELFFRGLLCNILVCLAVWMAAKAKEDTAKLILIFWCLFGFIGAGFEHSVANMTLLVLGLLAPHTNNAVTIMGLFNNLIPVTLGNMVGGALFVGLGYWFVSNKKETDK